MSDISIPRPALIMIRGLPGSGKSYLATALQEAIGTDQVVILDPDQIDMKGRDYQELSETLAKEGVEEKFFPNRFLKAEGYKAITEKKVIIWNQAFTDLGGFTRSSKSLQDFAASHNTNLPLLVVEIEIDYDTAKARIAKRAAAGKHDVPAENFARFMRDYTSFASKGFTVIRVNGEDDAAISVAAVLDALHNLS